MIRIAVFCVSFESDKEKDQFLSSIEQAKKIAAQNEAAREAQEKALDAAAEKAAAGRAAKSTAAAENQSGQRNAGGKNVEIDMIDL